MAERAVRAVSKIEEGLPLGISIRGSLEHAVSDLMIVLPGPLLLCCIEYDKRDSQPGLSEEFSTAIFEEI